MNNSYDNWKERKMKQVEAILSVSNQEVEQRGYTEDQIVAMDFEDDGIMLYMTDGARIKIKNKLIVGPIPDPDIRH